MNDVPLDLEQPPELKNYIIYSNLNLVKSVVKITGTLLVITNYSSEQEKW